MHVIGETYSHGITRPVASKRGCFFPTVLHITEKKKDGKRKKKRRMMIAGHLLCKGF